MGPHENPTSIPKIKRAAGGNGRRAGRGPGVACSRDASSIFVRGRRDSAIAVTDAGERRGDGRAGRRRRATERRRQEKRNATGRAGVIASESETVDHQPEEPVPEAARVITHNFFRRLLRPSWLLRGVRPAAALAPPTLLFARVPARPGTSLATRAALAANPRRLSRSRRCEDLERENGAGISRTY